MTGCDCTGCIHVLKIKSWIELFTDMTSTERAGAARLTATRRGLCPGPPTTPPTRITTPTSSTSPTGWSSPVPPAPLGPCSMVISAATPTIFSPHPKWVLTARSSTECLLWCFTPATSCPRPTPMSSPPSKGPAPSPTTSPWGRCRTSTTSTTPGPCLVTTPGARAMDPSSRPLRARGRAMSRCPGGPGDPGQASSLGTHPAPPSASQWPGPGTPSMTVWDPGPPPPGAQSRISTSRWITPSSRPGSWRRARCLAISQLFLPWFLQSRRRLDINTTLVCQTQALTFWTCPR